VISPRYLRVVCVLFALTLIPTLIHSYSDAAGDDGRRAHGIPHVLLGYTSVPTARPATWGQRRFQSDDWIEREYANGLGDRLTLTVVRSLDPKSVYHHPELAVSYHRESFDRKTVERFPPRPTIPVHVLRQTAEGRAIAVYALHYDNRFVDNPVLFQIRTAAELLLSPRQPMTLFFVLDQQIDRPRDLEASSALRLMYAAIDALLG
jgi:hypothetical protein